MLVSLDRLSTGSSTGLSRIVHDPAVLPAELVEEYRREVLRPGSALAFVRQAKASVGRREMRNNLLPRVGQITVPTLFVHGADDPLVSPETSRQAAERMPAARRIVVPDAGHWAQLEVPDRFLSELSHFLSTIEEDPASGRGPDRRICEQAPALLIVALISGIDGGPSHRVLAGIVRRLGA